MSKVPPARDLETGARQDTEYEVRKAMKTKEDVHRSLMTRANELERRMDQLTEAAAHASQEAETRAQAQLEPLRRRLVEVRTRLEAKADADERNQDAALAELGRLINDSYEEIMSSLK